MNISNDLERIGDIYFQITKTLEQKIEDKNYFTPEQRNSLNEMLGLLDSAFKEMVHNLNNPDYSKVDKSKAHEIEKKYVDRNVTVLNKITLTIIHFYEIRDMYVQ